MSLPHATEQMQWGDDLVFKIGGKMFAVVPLVPAPVKLSFKATPDEFAQLIEQPGIIPAPYLARAKWVALERLDALSREELKRLLTTSYELVRATLTKRVQAKLQPASAPTKRRSAKAPK